MKHPVPKFTALAIITATLLLIQGCTTTQQETPNPDVKKPLPFTKINNVPKAMLVDETPLNIDTTSMASDEESSADRKISAPQRTQSSRPKTEVSDYPAELIKGIKDPEEELLFDVNLDNAQLPELVAAFAAPSVLNFSYLIDPTVKGAVTVNIKTTLKAKEIWATFQHLLWLSGAYASPSNGFINILPFEKMAKEQKIFAQHEVQPNVDVLFIPIRYKKSADILNIIRPFMTDGATGTDIPDSNAIILVETPANTNKLQELIHLIDSKGEQEWPVRCFACREVDSDQLASEMQALLPVLGMPVAAATGPSNGAVKITSIGRLSAIVVSASMEEILDEVANWIKLLDKEDVQDKQDIFFYNVKHSTVAKVSSALDAFFNTTTTSASTSSSSTTSTTTTSSNNRNNNRNNQNTTNNNRTTNNTATTNRNATRTTTNQNNRNNTNNTVNTIHQTVFDTEVIVFTDDESNRLTIKTTPRAWKMIRAFLERQDIPPRQVSIHAIITDITLSKSNEFGISYSLSHMTKSDRLNAITGVMNGYGINPAMGDAASIVETGLGLLFKSPKRSLELPMMLIQAVAGTGNTKILSEPHAIVLSGSTAKLNVGDKIAIPTESTTYTDSENIRSNYEYTDTGVTMEVTPYITAGNEVRLVISQEISTPDYTQVTDSYTPPAINQKTLSTELIVPDNSTLLMGGMISTTKTTVLTGIPFLMDIPYLGWLFRKNTLSNKRTELLVLITVNVIDTQTPQEELIRRYKASLEEIEASNNANNNY